VKSDAMIAQSLLFGGKNLSPLSSQLKQYHYVS
jgi:hypothetical protein